MHDPRSVGLFIRQSYHLKLRCISMTAIKHREPLNSQATIIDGLRPNNKRAMTLLEANALFVSGETEIAVAGSTVPAVIFRRFPNTSTATFDTTQWKSVLPFGAPEGFDEPRFAAAWGGISLFVPFGLVGQSAWRYVYKVMRSILGPSIECRATFNPADSICHLYRDDVKLVFDRCIGRSWDNFTVAGLSVPTDRFEFPIDSTINLPLGYHVSATVSKSTPVSELNQMALCVGCIADLPPAPSAGDSDSSTQNAGSSGGQLVHAPQSEVADVELTPEEDPDVDDVELDSVVSLLIALLSDRVPLDLTVEALLYVYALKHNQLFFARRLDRIVSLDDGRCAEVLLHAVAFAYPYGDSGFDEWAHSFIPPIRSAARTFLSRSTLSVHGHVDLSAVDECTVLPSVSSVRLGPRELYIVLEVLRSAELCVRIVDAAAKGVLPEVLTEFEMRSRHHLSSVVVHASYQHMIVSQGSLNVEIVDAPIEAVAAVHQALWSRPNCRVALFELLKYYIPSLLSPTQPRSMFARSTVTDNEPTLRIEQSVVHALSFESYKCTPTMFLASWSIQMSAQLIKELTPLCNERTANVCAVLAHSVGSSLESGHLLGTTGWCEACDSKSWLHDLGVAERRWQNLLLNEMPDMFEQDPSHTTLHLRPGQPSRLCYFSMHASSFARITREVSFRLESTVGVQVKSSVRFSHAETVIMDAAPPARKSR